MVECVCTCSAIAERHLHVELSSYRATKLSNLIHRSPHPSLPRSISTYPPTHPSPSPSLIPGPPTKNPKTQTCTLPPFSTRTTQPPRPSSATDCPSGTAPALEGLVRVSAFVFSFFSFSQGTPSRYLPHLVREVPLRQQLWTVPSVRPT